MDNKKRRKEMEICHSRVSPVLSEFLEGWVLTGHRVGCKTKVVIGDFDRSNQDLGERMLIARGWKKLRG